MTNSKIFKAYDIRGIYPTEINEDNFSDIIKAIYSLFTEITGKKDLTIALGRDMRLSGPVLFEKAKQALIESGVHVVDIGLTSTPTVYYAVMKFKYDAGIQISASHNPKNYNGMKFFVRKGTQAFKISKETGMEEVKRRFFAKDFISNDRIGTVTIKSDVLTNEVNDALSLVHPPNKKKLKIVADPANTMGILYINEIAKQYPIDLIPLNFNLDGSFPSHAPDPLDFSTLEELQKEVIKQHADLGIATDGDGDRVFFVDEKGEIIPATIITSLIAKEALQGNPGQKIVFDIRYTRNADAAVKKYGGRSIISRVGHAFITKLVNDESAFFAGESSGHFFFLSTGGAESAIQVILYMIRAIQEEQKPISSIVSQLMTSFESGEYNYILPENTDSKIVLQKILKEMPQGVVSTLDGISVDYPEWRFNIRTSNTEPLLRLNLESNSIALTKEKKIHMDKLIQSFGGKPK